LFLYNDRILTCADCSQEFAFTASEQEFYAQRQFTDPRRCTSCRASRKAARGDTGGSSYSSSYSSGGGYGGGSRSGGGYGGESRGPREMFPATCSSCGREAMVPFRPTNGKPVYCNDCFATRRA
jgi:CxxC-x17-CxxC domain-containing protein